MVGRWFSPGTPVSSTNKTDRHDITEILLKVALKTMKPTYQPIPCSLINLCQYLKYFLFLHKTNEIKLEAQVSLYRSPDINKSS